MRTFNIKPTDREFAAQVQEKIDNLNKPKGSLGELERVMLQMGLIQGTLSPQVLHPSHVLFGADHGIEREGVSISPREVTRQQMSNFARGGGGVNVLCRQHGVDLTLVDVGVDCDFSEMAGGDVPLLDRKIGRGTRNFLREAAMTAEEMDRAVEIGVEMADAAAAKGCNTLSLGEMGIGNTSPSSEWMYFFQGVPLDLCVGAGAGLSEGGVNHKLGVLTEAAQNFMRESGIESATPLTAPEGWRLPFGQRERPFFPAYAAEIIRWFGGFEMVAAIGAMLRGAERRMALLIDGFIMSACALAASQLCPQVLDYCIFAHVGNERGHQLMLHGLGVRPLLALGMRLGEGTGALAALPLVQSAVKMLDEMGNFEQNHITKYF